MSKFEGYVVAKQSMSAPFTVHATTMERAEQIVEGMVNDGYPFQWSEDDEPPEFDMIAEIGDDGEDGGEDDGDTGEGETEEPSPRRGAVVTVRSKTGTPGMDEFPTTNLPKHPMVAHAVILDQLHQAQSAIARLLGRDVTFGGLIVTLGEPFDLWEGFRKRDTEPAADSAASA